MALPTIKLDQPGGAGPGVAGVSRVDLVLNQVVNISDPANGTGSYSFAFLGKPDGSAAVLNNPLTATPSWTPDAPGDFLIEETFVDTNGVTWKNTIVGGVTTANNNWIIPAPGETKELGDDGWSPGREQIYLDLDTGFCTGFLDLAVNDALGVGAVGKARIKWNQAAGTLEASLDGGSYQTIAFGASGIQYYDIDTSAPVPTIDLPLSPPVGEVRNYKDVGNNASVNNITLNGNGNNVEFGPTLVLNQDGGAVTIRFDGTQWHTR